MLTTYFNIEDYRNIGGIYYIINIITNKKYIGSTKNFYRRYREHSLNTSCFDLKQDMLKYRKENFFFKIVDILEDISYSNLEKIEQEHLNLYYAQEYILTRRQDNRFRILLYNRMPKSSKRNWFKYSEETKELWSKQRRGSNNSRYGVIISEEQKEKIRNTYKEKYKNGYINPNQGKTTKESTKIKMKEAWKKSGKIRDVYILSLLNNNIYKCNSYKEGEILTGVNSADIGRICNNKQLYSKDYFFSHSEINEDNKEDVCQRILTIKENRKVKHKLSVNKGTKLWKKVILKNILSDEEEIFFTIKECCTFLKTNGATLKKYIKSQKSYRNQYKISYYENKDL